MTSSKPPACEAALSLSIPSEGSSDGHSYSSVSLPHPSFWRLFCLIALPGKSLRELYLEEPRGGQKTSNIERYLRFISSSSPPTLQWQSTLTMVECNSDVDNDDLGLQKLEMASSDVDTKFLGKFAANMDDSPLLSANLFQILGNLTMLSSYVIKARKLRRLDTTRHTKSADLYCRIIWYAKIGLEILEENILPMMAKYSELKALAYKLRASYYHLYVLFHNKPAISFKAGAEISTPPGLMSPRNKIDKGKSVDRGSPADLHRPGSVQPTHALEGGPVGGEHAPVEFAPDFLIPAEDYRPIALACFREACSIADKNLWGSHPLRLSVKVEMCAFLYDCLHEREQSRQLAKATISEVYNAKEGMDDDMFEDAAELVGILGRMMKRGLGSNSGSTAAASEVSKATPAVDTMPGMMNPI